MWTHIWTSCWSFTVNDQYILQLIAIDPEDDLFVEKFLGIRAFDSVPAVPHSEQSVTPEPENKTRIKLPTHDPELVEILLRVQDNLRQGVLPQPPFLSKHPRRGHHHPLALSPHGFPAEYFLHEGLPHDYGKNSEEEVIKEILWPFKHKVEGNSEYAWLIKANPTLETLLEETPLDTVNTVDNPWDMLFNPMEKGKTIEEWLTGEAAFQELPPVSSGVEVEIHPEEKLQRKSESERISDKVKNTETNSHSGLSLWDSFVSTIPEPPGQRAQMKTI